MKKAIALLLCLVLAVGVFAGCGVKNKFVGEWRYTQSYIEFILELRIKEENYTDEELQTLEAEYNALRLHIRDNGTYMYDLGMEGSSLYEGEDMSLSLEEINSLSEDIYTIDDSEQMINLTMFMHGFPDIDWIEYQLVEYNGEFYLLALSGVNLVDNYGYAVEGEATYIKV